MIRRWIIKKSKGELATFTMVYVLLFFTATVAFALQIRQYISLKTYTEDALAASNLASAVIDIQEYGVNHNLIIKEAMTYIRQFVEFNPSMLFELGRSCGNDIKPGADGAVYRIQRAGNRGRGDLIRRKP